MADVTRNQGSAASDDSSEGGRRCAGERGRQPKAAGIAGNWKEGSPTPRAKPFACIPVESWQQLSDKDADEPRDVSTVMIIPNGAVLATTAAFGQCLSVASASGQHRGEGASALPKARSGRKVSEGGCCHCSLTSGIKLGRC